MPATPGSKNNFLKVLGTRNRKIQGWSIANCILSTEENTELFLTVSQFPTCRVVQCFLGWSVTSWSSLDCGALPHSYIATQPYSAIPFTGRWCLPSCVAINLAATAFQTPWVRLLQLWGQNRLGKGLQSNGILLKRPTVSSWHCSPGSPALLFTRLAQREHWCNPSG